MPAIKLHCNYCNKSWSDYAYSNIEARRLRCPRCNSGYKDLEIKVDTNGNSHCKDCGDETKPGPGSVRCERCWKDRFGAYY